MFQNTFCMSSEESEELLVRMLATKAFSFEEAKVKLLQLESFKAVCQNSKASNLRRILHCFKESELKKDLAFSPNFFSARKKLLEEEISMNSQLDQLMELREKLELNPRFRNQIDRRLREIEYIRSDL